MKNNFILLFGVILFTLSLTKANAQVLQKGEKAICNIQVNNKQYNLDPNQVGYFPRISNIKPLAKVPIEIFYPDGVAGEKVIVGVLDGGNLDSNKMVRIVPLNAQKKCVFNFQVTDNLELFQVTLRKGNDFKTIQLWVGAEPKPVNQ